MPRWIRRASDITIAVAILLLVWGVEIEPRLIDERSWTVIVPRLPPAWQGQRIALIADLQVGMWLGNTDAIRRIVARLAEIKPASVLIAGDFVYKPTDEDETDESERDVTRDFMGEVNAAVALLRGLIQAEIRVYGALGNHDYGINLPD